VRWAFPVRTTRRLCARCIHSSWELLPCAEVLTVTHILMSLRACAKWRSRCVEAYWHVPRLLSYWPISQLKSCHLEYRLVRVARQRDHWLRPCACGPRNQFMAARNFFSVHSNSPECPSDSIVAGLSKIDCHSCAEVPSLTALAVWNPNTPQKSEFLWSTRCVVHRAQNGTLSPPLSPFCSWGRQEFREYWRFQTVGGHAYSFRRFTFFLVHTAPYDVLRSIILKQAK
jgi:hypothetical protein